MQWNNPVIQLKSSETTSWIILQNIIIPTLLVVMSAMSSLVMNSSIQGALAIGDNLQQWITINYLLGINCTVPIANLFADKYGYKKLYFIGTAIFALGTFLVGIAPNFEILALARLIEGIGGGIIFPVGLAIVSKQFPKEKLSLAINLYLGLSFGLGIAGGTMLAGYIGMYHNWRLLFYLLMPNCLIAMLITWLMQKESDKKSSGKFDLAGYLFFVLFLASLIVAISNGNLKATTNGWRAPWIIGLFILSFFSLLAFIRIEKTSANPFIHLSLFTDPLFFVGCITLFTLGLSIFSSPSMMAKYMEQGLMYDKLTTGMVLCGYGLAFGFCSVLTNYISKLVPTPLLTIIGLAIIISSYFLNNMLTLQSGKIAISTILFLRGAGVAISLGPITSQSLKRAPQEELAEASSLLTFFRQVGGTFGGIILGVVLIRRNIFHNALFFEPINEQLPGYMYSFQKLQYHVAENIGSTPLEAQAQAKLMIVENVEKQSLIQSINDGMIFFGYLTLAVSLILVLLNVIEFYKQRKISNK